MDILPSLLQIAKAHHQVLTAEKAFLCLSMFNTVRLSMTLFFPFAISQWGEMNVSINRIQVRHAATCLHMIIC